MITFRYGYGKFKFEMMSFILMIAPATLQLMMDGLLRQLSFVRVFIDEKVMHSTCKEIHFNHNRMVLELLTEYGRKIKLRKSFFLMLKIMLLDHIVDENSLHADSERTDRIRNANQLKTKR